MTGHIWQNIIDQEKRLKDLNIREKEVSQVVRKLD